MKKEPEPARRREKLTDADRHKRFVETAKAVGASDKETDFDDAFMKVVQKKKP